MLHYRGFWTRWEAPSRDHAYYSAPYRLVGQQLWVRGGARTVELDDQNQTLLSTHDRATTRGERKTCLDHLPPEKVAGPVLTRESCRAQVEASGPVTLAVVERLLAHRPEDRLRRAGRLVRLATPYGTERLERACARAQHFGTADFPSGKRILAEGLDRQPLADPPSATDRRRSATTTPGRSSTFARQASEFVASLLGGSRP